MSGTTEHTFFTNGAVTVTDKRFIVESQTYAISGITSVKFVEIKPNRVLPFVLLVGAILLLVKFSGGASIWHYMLVSLPWIIWLAVQRRKYTVTLTTASGEARALVSRKPKFVHQVIDSLNAAIIARA